MGRRDVAAWDNVEELKIASLYHGLRLYHSHVILIVSPCFLRNRLSYGYCEAKGHRSGSNAGGAENSRPGLHEIEQWPELYRV